MACSLCFTSFSKNLSIKFLASIALFRSISLFCSKSTFLKQQACKSVSLIYLAESTDYQQLMMYKIFLFS